MRRIMVVLMLLMVAAFAEGCASQQIKEKAVEAADKLIDKGVDAAFKKLKEVNPETVKHELKVQVREYLGVDTVPIEGEKKDEPAAAPEPAAVKPEDKPAEATKPDGQ